MTASTQSTILHYGILLMSVMAVVQIVPSSDIDAALQFSLICFSASIPLLSAVLVYHWLRKSGVPTLAMHCCFTRIASAAGLVCGFAGIGGLFMAHSAAAAVIYVLVSAVLLVSLCVLLAIHGRSEGAS